MGNGVESIKWENKGEMMGSNKVMSGGGGGGMAD